jgi:hypothetical protein
VAERELGSPQLSYECLLYGNLPSTLVFYYLVLLNFLNIFCQIFQCPLNMFVMSFVFMWFGSHKPLFLGLLWLFWASNCKSNGLKFTYLIAVLIWVAKHVFIMPSVNLILKTIIHIEDYWYLLTFRACKKAVVLLLSHFFLISSNIWWNLRKERLSTRIRKNFKSDLSYHLSVYQNQEIGRTLAAHNSLWFFFLFFFYFFFFERLTIYKLHKPGWPWTGGDPPTSSSWVLGGLTLLFDYWFYRHTV